MTPAIALATYLVLAVAIFGLFARGSRRLDGDTRARMRRFIARDPDRNGDRDQDCDRDWAEGFVRWFDHAFAVRIRRVPILGELPLPSFRRSILVSFTSLLVLALVWITNKPGVARSLVHGDTSPQMWEMTGRLVLVYGGATLITNWIPDYLSLVESRLIMAKMARARSWTRRLAWLAVDGGATLAISFFAIHLGMVLLLPVVTPTMEIEVGCLTPDSYSLATTAELFVAGLQFESPAGTLNYDATGIYIYSTFLTSVWVWIYLIGGFVLRLLVGLGLSAPREPLRAMGVIVVLVFGAVFWPSWIQRRAHSADVYIHHLAADSEAAAALAAELRAGGLRVRSAADSDAQLERELLARAETVILLDSRKTMTALDPVAAALYRMGEDGVRSWGAATRVHVPSSWDVDAGLGGAWDPAWYWAQRADRQDAALIWSPGRDSAPVVRWAQRASPILSSRQVRACRALHEKRVQGADRRR